MAYPLQHLSASRDGEKTYSSTQQWCRLVKRHRIRQGYRRRRISHQVLRESAIMLKPRCLAPTTEPRIHGPISSLRRNTVRALRAGTLEVQHPDPVPGLPLPCILAHLNYHTGRFMRRDHWQWTVYFTLEDLEIGVAEPRCVNADEEFIAADGGDRDPCEGVGSVVLSFY